MSTTVSLSDCTVGELAAAMPASIRIFEAWKNDYCCGGLTPLPEACSAAGKTVDEFASTLEGSAAAPDGVARDWSTESLIGIAAHIVDSYHRYTREDLQREFRMRLRGGLHEHVIAVHRVVEREAGIEARRRKELEKRGVIAAARIAERECV